MNLQDDYTRNIDKLQAVHQDWSEKIASHLPKNIEDIMEESKVIKRKRGIGNAIGGCNFFCVSELEVLHSMN